MSRILGRVRRVWALLAGDRRSEAVGRLEETGRPTDEATVARVESAVRRKEGDTAR